MNTAPQLSTIGKYRLIASIGHGGMAHIHLAVMAGPAGFNKLLVVKALREDITGTGPADEFVTMFLDEARLAARLNHPNIVQTYEVGEAGGRFFIAMEHLEGQAMKTVERRLAPVGLPVPMLLRVLSEVAKGLHHAHELRGFDNEPLGVVHRDVSPHNVFLTYDGQVKLLDFGIAKASNAMHLTKVGVIKGKAEYIAPEQIRGENVDRRADIFSLGVMMWEGLAHRRFAGGPEVAEITKMHNRLTGGEPKLRTVVPDVPERLAQICDKALALQPEDRYATAAELAHDLDAYLAEHALHPTAAQLSQLLTPLFQKEREQLRKLIEEQMKLALDPAATFEANTGQLPVLPRNTYASGVWMMPPGGLGNTPTGLRVGDSRTSSMPSPLGPSQPLPAFDLHAMQPKKTVPWPAVIGFVVISVAVATFLAVRPHPENAQASASVQAAAIQPALEPTVHALPSSAAPSVAAQPASDDVHVRIAVEPLHAQVNLDGARLTAIPFEAEVGRSKQMHTLEVSALGYASQREMLTFDRDLEVRIVLEREEVSRRVVRGSASAPVAHEEPTQAPQPSAPAAKSATPVEAEPGMDFRRLAPGGHPAANHEVVLEEDPYR